MYTLKYLKCVLLVEVRTVYKIREGGPRWSTWPRGLCSCKNYHGQLEVFESRWERKTHPHWWRKNIKVYSFQHQYQQNPYSHHKLVDERRNSILDFTPERNSKKQRGCQGHIVYFQWVFKSFYYGVYVLDHYDSLNMICFESTHAKQWMKVSLMKQI